MIYITYSTCNDLYYNINKNNVSIYKKVLEGDSFEIVEFNLPKITSRSLDRSVENIEYNQNLSFTIKTDMNVYETFNIDVGQIICKTKTFYNPNPSHKEIIPFLRMFGISCKNETVLFKPIEKDNFSKELIYAGEQLKNWLIKKTQYIDDMFEKINEVQKKKLEIEKDFKPNLAGETFKPEDIPDYQFKEYSK